MTLRELAAFLERHGDRAPELLWLSALGLLDNARQEAAGRRLARWRASPRHELRQLRDDVARALELAHLSVLLQEEENERQRERDPLTGPTPATLEAERRRRRYWTMQRMARRYAKQAGAEYAPTLPGEPPNEWELRALARLAELDAKRRS